MAVVKVIQPQGRPRKIIVPMRNWAVEVGEWVIQWMENTQPYRRVATGKTINSLEVTVRGNWVQLSGASSLKWALQGRKAGKFPNVDAIKDWIVVKKFSLIDISLNSLAFLIGRKIANFGTNEPKLREQNLVIVINSIGKKYLNQMGDIEAQAASDAMVKALTKYVPNTKVQN